MSAEKAIFINQWLEFIKSQLPMKDRGNILPIEREKDLEYEWKPESQEEFYLTINQANGDILKGFGFIPYRELPEEVYRQNQREVDNLLGSHHELFLFPAEWYDIIPRNYLAVTIFGEVFNFEPGISDNSVRAGCLSYGIPVLIED